MIPRPDRRFIRGFAALALAAVAVAPAAAGSMRRDYTLTDLGAVTPGGISNAGDVVSISWGAYFNPQEHGVHLSRDGNKTRLTPPPDPAGEGPMATYQSSRISPSGSAVAYTAMHYNGGPNIDGVRSTLVTGGRSIDLTPRKAPGSMPVLVGVAGVNDHGEAVGSSTTASPDAWGMPVFEHRNFLSTERHGGGRREIDLGDLMPTGINNRGQVVGSSPTGPDHVQATIGEVRDGQVTLTRLGTLGGQGSYATAINDAGQVVGDSSLLVPEGPRPPVADFWPVPPSSTGTWHAFLYEDGAMRDLGTLPGHLASTALAINARGQVVGTSSTPYGPASAFLHEDGAMIDLNDLLPAESGWQLEQALGINDQGQIVGIGSYSRPGDPMTPELLALLEAAWESGTFLDPATLGFDPGVYETRGFLLAPAPVPEPTALAVPAMAGVALLARRRLLRGRRR